MDFTSDIIERVYRRSLFPPIKQLLSVSDSDTMRPRYGMMYHHLYETLPLKLALKNILYVLYYAKIIYTHTTPPIRSLHTYSRTHKRTHTRILTHTHFA